MEVRVGRACPQGEEALAGVAAAAVVAAGEAAVAADGAKKMVLVYRLHSHLH